MIFFSGTHPPKSVALIDRNSQLYAFRYKTRRKHEIIWKKI